jgi:hypothetical protein
MRSTRWVVALFATACADAQTSLGALSGTITDPSGGVVAGAHVSLTHATTRARRAAISNGAGIYRFDAVELGTQELRVTHPGFRTFVATDLAAEANRTAVFDIRLQLGSEAESVQVSAEGRAAPASDSPLRGGNFPAADVSRLPLTGLNPLSLARTLPGVIEPSGSATGNQGGGAAVQFSIDGQRQRGNSFLLDGTENNDLQYTGMAQPFNIADAVEEVSVQSGNYSVEFGRASGGVLNVVTKAGTNSLHGALFWRYQSQRFNSVSNVDKQNNAPKAVFARNLAGFTAGGPLRKNKTFFFGGFQEDTNHSTANFKWVLPTSAAVDRLRSLFPANPRLDLYLGTLGNLRGESSVFPQALGSDPFTGRDRGSVDFGAAIRASPRATDNREWLARIDHHWSEKHRLSARYIYDSALTSPAGESYPGYIVNSGGERNQNVLIADSYTFGPSYTNELRFAYGRLNVDPASIASGSAAAAWTLPPLQIANVSAPGINQAFQFRHVNNALAQETQSKLVGAHSLRFGAELLAQSATQQGTSFPLGHILYDASPDYSAFANFLDDFSGLPGRIQRTIGSGLFHPDELRQAYFFQDTWNAKPSLTVTLGLRYEHPGQLANALRYPAFTGFDPDLFLKPNRVDADAKDFGPAFGLAWSPGARKAVLRGGYQISYQPLYSQILSLDLASATPNAISVDVHASATTGRGDPNWFEQLPAASPRPPSLLDAQFGTIEKGFRNPYVERWSFGFQRQVAGQLLLDISYVGAESHRLTVRSDVNPRQPDGSYLHPDFGARTIRSSQGNADYHALQARLDRRLRRGLQLTASYTWSKAIDSASDGIGQFGNQSGQGSVPSVPAALGGLKLDRGLSDFDRTHRLTVLSIWEIPVPKQRVWKQALGGWSLAGIATFQSGTPYTARNGFDRNGDGWSSDRPDVGNPDAPIESRAIRTSACASGYSSPDSNTCVSPAAVHWLQGAGFPNASTAGRNTLHTGGTNNIDLTLLRTCRMGERGHLEFRWEAQNLFNHPQYVNVPGRDVAGTPAGHFLNRGFTDGGIRSMWLQLKLLF